MQAGHAPRERILRILGAEPGLHLRELTRRAEVSLSTARYHLDDLARRGLVREHRIGRFVRYFSSDLGARDDRALISALRVDGERRTLEALLRVGPLGFNALRERTRLPPATLSLYLTLLLRDGLVDHRTDRKYALAEPAPVASRLAGYRARFPDLLADSAREIFEEFA